MSSIITPQKQRGGLFSVATAVPHDSPDIDWTPNGGWAMRSQCPSGGSWCCDGGQGTTEKQPPADVSYRRYKPFAIYNTAGCGTGTSRTPQAVSDAAESNRLWHDTNMEGWVSYMLEHNHCDFNLSDDAVDLSGVPAEVEPAVTIEEAISTLLRFRAVQGAAPGWAMWDRPVIHMPTWIAPFLSNDSWVTSVADLVFGPGYGVDPAGWGGQDSWVYITGPVEYSLLPVVHAPKDSLKEWRQNIDVQLVESFAIFRYDPCRVFKTRVRHPGPAHVGG